MQLIGIKFHRILIMNSIKVEQQQKGMSKSIDGGGRKV